MTTLPTYFLSKELIRKVHEPYGDTNKDDDLNSGIKYKNLNADMIVPVVIVNLKLL